MARPILPYAAIGLVSGCTIAIVQAHALASVLVAGAIAAATASIYALARR